MATAQLYLGPELEELVEKLQTFGREFKDKQNEEARARVPLGRPKTKFKLTPEQMREIAALQIKYPSLEHPVIVKKMDEFKDLWRQERDAEEEQRRRARYPQAYYKNSVTRQVREATADSFTMRSMLIGGRITKQSILLGAVAIGLRHMVVLQEKAQEKAKLEEAAEASVPQPAPPPAKRERVFDTSGVKKKVDVSPSKKTR